MDNALGIGDIVCLYSEETLGFVYSTQTSSYHNGLAVGSREDRRRPSVADQYTIAFEICTPNRYKLSKQYRKLKTQLLTDPDNSRLKNAASHSKMAAESEKEDNEMEQKKNQGKKVLYGQIVQLRHLFTNKYIHISTTKTSYREGNNMAVELHSHNSKQAYFRIMPRYKVKAEGDTVQAEDHVVLESIKSQGQFLHVSRMQLGSQSVYSHSFELNLSVLQSGFTLYRKYKPSSDDSLKVKAGDPIRFFHKEMEAYLVAEGLFDDELTEDVHLRLRPVDQSNPRTRVPSSSAITYWQVELQEGPVAGGVLKWEQQCRIIHMCTRRYLAVNRRGEVTLEADGRNPSTVFRLHAVTKETDDVLFESYARIKHVVTGSWLHALTDEYVRRQGVQVTDDPNSMAGLQYTTAHLKKVTAFDEKHYDDAFTIQHVDSRLVDIFHYMAGMVPFLQKLVRDKQLGDVLNAKVAYTAIASMKEMKDFMIDQNVASKDRQKLLRNLRVVELLVSLLQVPYIDTPDQQYLTNIFVEAYNVLCTQLIGNSRKNELYIAKHIDVFLTQFEYKAIGVYAAQMVMELIRDNRKILDRISHAHIDTFVGFLQREKNYRYLELLSVLCICDGVSIVDNQNYITRTWLARGSKDCVYLTEFGDKIGLSPDVVFVSMDNGRNWQELRTFAHGRSHEDEDYLFLEKQLELFGMLCHGQNEFAIKVITQDLSYLSWKEAFTCLADTHLPERLRSKYCDLIITLFVDVTEGVSAMDRVQLSYVYSDITAREQQQQDDNDNDEEDDKGRSLKSQYFRPLRDWISTFLVSNDDMTASLVGNNMLVQQVLRLVLCLVRRGCFAKPRDLDMLLKPLMGLLDGRNDRPYPRADDDVLERYRSTGRFQKNVETKFIVDAKLQALEVLELLFNYTFNLRMIKFMRLFREVSEQKVAVRLHSGHQHTPSVHPFLEKTFVVKGNQGICQAAVKQLQDIFDQTDMFVDCEIVDTLLDLAHYDYDEMVSKSLHLLNRYFSAYRALFNCTIQAQVLLTDSSVQVSRQLEKLMPSFRRLSTAKLSRDKAEELVSILNHLISMCHLEGEMDEPHAINQNILYNNGVLEDAFTILNQNTDVEQLGEHDEFHLVIQKTLTLLRFLARGNRTIQSRLFDRMNLLLSTEGLWAESAQCLTEVFAGNTDACTKVTSQQIHRVVTLAAQHRDHAPQLLDLLASVVKVQELQLPVKRNQGLVMTYFLQYRADLAAILDQPPDVRESILTSQDSKQLHYFLAMVDLLASCAEGDNQYIASICQTIFSIPELLRVLNNPAIRNSSKRPFLRFLLCVYLSSAGGAVESGAGDFSQDRRLWQYLEAVTIELRRVTSVVSASPHLAARLLRRPGGRCETTSLPEEELWGTLDYVFSAVMPFLQVFCRTYYRPDPEGFPEGHRKLSSLTLTFERQHYSSFVFSSEEFRRKCGTLVTMEAHLKNLISTLTFLVSASKAVPVSKLRALFQRFVKTPDTQDVASDAVKAYRRLYKEEEELNTNLKTFAVNMQAAYGGLNTVRVQTGYPSDNSYSEVGGDEELPLGQEFQDHLKVFVEDRVADGGLHYSRAGRLVRQLQIMHSTKGMSEDQKKDQLDLDMKCLQLLRGLIHTFIVRLPPGWEHSPEENAKHLRAISNAQTSLVSHGVVTSVLGHLGRPEDCIVREVLAFLAALLFNGNEDVQPGFHLTMLPLRKAHGGLGDMSIPTGGTKAPPWVSKVALPAPPSHALVGRETRLQAKSHTGAAVTWSQHQQELPQVLMSTGIEADFQFKDEGYIELVLRVLGLMCDNQYRDLQDYLREQPGNINTINLVAETTIYLNVIYVSIDDKSAPLVTQLINTLVEFSSGSFQNQAIVLENKICEYLNYILRLTDFKNCTMDQVYDLKMSIAVLIRSLTEENPPRQDESSDQTSSTIKRTTHMEVLQSMDGGVLLAAMSQAYQDCNRKGHEAEIQETGFAYFHILCRKMDLDHRCTKEGLVKTSEDAAAWEFFASNTLSIEIVKNDVLQKVYFQVKDKNVLRQEIKEKFKYDVDRSSPSNKLREFMDWSVDIINDIKYQRRIHANPLARLLIQMKWWWNATVLLLSLALCLIVFITWKAPESSADPTPDMSDWPGAQYLIYILGAAHILLSLLVVGSYFLSNKPTFPHLADIIPSLSNRDSGKPKVLSGPAGNTKTPDIKRKSYLEVKFFSFMTFYYLAFLACSVLGTVFYAYFFSFHLLHVVLMNQMLSRVIQAVTRNGLSLVLVAILGLVFIFMFSLVSFAFLRDLLDDGNGRQCRTAYECFVTVLHHGLVAGMYTTFEQQLTGLSFPHTLAVATFDVVFFIIISTIGLNMIFGIIVDTFAELRDAKWQTDQDMQNRCFICSCESYDFERQAVGFEKHVKEEHNQWAYLFFFIHLDETHPNDYSALELHVYRLWKKRSSDFFPLNRAMSLKTEEDSHKGKLEALMTQVEFLVGKIKEEETAKAKQKEKKRQKEWKSKHKMESGE
ncbi:inositol 1,4,5-trisphosphate receptor type 3-like [Pomacea canaliculata]|uniref:inositol 1,4,5-trisphosphate receptor type 3-like n=1 Tax=Pomacea canaliculata TaxID=400727 RepID=UPI000D726ED3|nr:inositol 1,4,5-trisphosphate receptor type 3-like [Pomacea canaliculata]